MKLNLGCADRRIEGFLSVDIAGADIDQKVDLAGPWPWPDSSVEEVKAFDVFEHIGDADFLVIAEVLSGKESGRHPRGRIHCMNELHRVLSPGGIAEIEVPDASFGTGFIQDPTHVTPWCRSSFKYFEHGAFARGRLGPAYGITASFEVLSMQLFDTNGEWPGDVARKIRALLKAVK